MLHSFRSRIFSLGLFLLGCSASAPRPAPSAAPAETPLLELRLAATPFPPFSDERDKPHVAFDLVSSALERTGYAASMQIVAQGTLNAELQEGRFDGSPALWRSAEREAYLLYSDAYLENRLVLVGVKGSSVEATSFAALPGKKIGIVEGYAYGPELEAAKEPVFVKAASTEDSFRALLRGEIDYVLADALVVHQLVHDYPVQTQERLSVGGTALLTRTLHLAVRKSRPDAARIIEGFNRQLAQMLSDGSYHRALEVDWIHADIDGDGQLELVAASERVGAKHPGSGYRVVSIASGGAGAQAPHDPGTARIVIKGVFYDSWEAVPDDYKTSPSGLDNKPRTLRVQIFEF